MVEGMHFLSPIHDFIWSIFWLVCEGQAADWNDTWTWSQLLNVEKKEVNVETTGYTYLLAQIFLICQHCSLRLITSQLYLMRFFWHLHFTKLSPTPYTLATTPTMHDQAFLLGQTPLLVYPNCPHCLLMVFSRCITNVHILGYWWYTYLSWNLLTVTCLLNKKFFSQMKAQGWKQNYSI